MRTIAMLIATIALPLLGAPIWIAPLLGVGLFLAYMQDTENL